MNAALERAQAKLSDRRSSAVPDSTGRVQAGQKRHNELKLGYKPAGQGMHGPMLYLLIQYCPDCLRGTVVDLVREVPANLPDARQMVLKQARPWRLECVAKAV